MRKTPEGWPRISSALFYDDASAAIDWLCRVFGFETRLKIEGDNGTVHHSELVFADGLIMVAPADPLRRSPRALGGANTQSLMVYVDDVDAHHARARAAGAKILKEPTTTDYGEEYFADRNYEVEDLEGHRWWFSQRMKTGGKK